MNATASKFDADRFRKVHALLAGAANDGEWAAAKAKADAIARNKMLQRGETMRSAHKPPERTRPGGSRVTPKTLKFHCFQTRP